MPFSTPTLSDHRAQLRAEFQARLPEADSTLRSSNLRVIADVVAGAMALQYGYLGWISSQILPDTAESAYLERWARIFGVLRKPAAASAGRVAVTGTPGAGLPAGVELRRGDAVRYRVTDGAVLAADGTGTVAVRAIDAGAAGNAASGARLALATAVAGIDGTLIVTGDGLGGGADAENDAALRQRLLRRIQEPPHGGAGSDYEVWALEVPGVTRAWVAEKERGVGTVTVRFVMDEARAAYGGLPQAEDVARVAAWIEERRPVTADVLVLAPIAAPLDVTIAGLSPSTPEVRSAVEASLADMLAREGQPGGTIALSLVWEAVATASGERRHRIVSPADDVQFGQGALPVLGQVTYV